MATRESKTKVSVEFQGKGAERLQRQAEQLAKHLSPEKLSGGFKRMEYHMKQNERQLQGMSKHFKSLNQELHKTSKAVKEINELTKALKGLADQAQKTGGGGGGGGAPSRGSGPRFTQGLVQGLGIGEYLPSSPGMGRQIGGRMIGRGMRGAAHLGRSVAMTPFQGMGAIAGGLASIPGGGIVGGQLQAMFGYGGQALAYERTKMQTAGMIGRDFMPGQYKTIKGTTGPLPAADAPGVRDKAIEMIRARRQGKAQTSVHGFSSVSGVVSEKEIEAMIPTARNNLRKSTKDRRVVLRKGLAEVGIDYGMGKQQALQFAGGIGHITGRADETAAMLPTAMAAQQAYGISAGATAQFGVAGRRGGLTGKQGTGGMVAAMEEAVKAGMDKAEIRDFMEQTAAGIRNFAHTGIPMHPGSIARIGKSMGGIQAERANVLAQRFAGAAANVGMQGPQNAADLAMLQTVGGFKGGGLESLEEAEQNLINFKHGETGPDEFRGLVDRVSGGSKGGAAGRRALRRTLRQFGMQITPDESRMLQEGGKGARHLETELIGGEKGLRKQGRETVGAAMRRQAGVENRQLGIGQKSLKTMQEFAKAQAKATDVVAQKVMPAMSALADVANSIVNRLGGVAGGGKPGVNMNYDVTISTPSDGH